MINKQNAIESLVNRIKPELLVLFDDSKRAKSLYGRCYPRQHKIIFYRPLFKYTLESCLHCAFHELAHYIQFEQYGYVAHDKLFEIIQNNLITDYGNSDIAAANKEQKSRCYSEYTLDDDTQTDIQL